MSGRPYARQWWLGNAVMEAYTYRFLISEHDVAINATNKPYALREVSNTHLQRTIARCVTRTPYRQKKPNYSAYSIMRLRFDTQYD